MIPVFINNLSEINQLSYPGYLGICQFSLAHYQDADFSRTGIMQPKEMALAVNKRKAEYLAGRYLVRWLLQKAGLPDMPVGIAHDRTPCWPVGVTGSISHSNDTAICAISYRQSVSATGIDVETIMPQPTATNLVPLIISEVELRFLLSVNSRPASMTFPLLLTLVFSAKESLFKALFPLVRIYFDFLDASVVNLDQQNQQFSIKLERTLNTQFTNDQVFNGQYYYSKDKVTTLIYF